MWFRNWPDLTDTQTVVLELILAAVLFLLFYPFKRNKK